VVAKKRGPVRAAKRPATSTRTRSPRRASRSRAR
jgi:hypothetical protein